MYQSFKQMIAELYNNPDFIEYCYIEGRKYKCLCSSMGNNIMFTEAGMVDEVNFTIDLELATLDRIPHQGDKVVFRNKTYKIASTETDSADASLKLYLISTSKGA